MDWVRIDNRLVHGQIIETWLPHTRAQAIVVANDAVAEDAIQREIMSLAIPGSVSAHFVPVHGLAALLESLDSSAIVLFSSCTDARDAYDAGVRFEVLNVGNIHYAKGRRQLSPSVALSADDEDLLRGFEKQGVKLDFRCVPGDPVQVRF